VRGSRWEPDAMAAEVHVRTRPQTSIPKAKETLILGMDAVKATTTVVNP
jgi:hypothetical protein